MQFLMTWIKWRVRKDRDFFFYVEKNIIRRDYLNGGLYQGELIDLKGAVWREMTFDELFDAPRRHVHARTALSRLSREEFPTHRAPTEPVKFSTGILIVNLLVRERKGGREREREKGRWEKALGIRQHLYEYCN